MTLPELYEKMDELGVDLVNCPAPNNLAFSTMLSDGHCYIFMDNKNITEKEEKLKVAHELGHCATGSFYNQHSHPLKVAKCEEKARRWEYKSLLPWDELRAAILSGQRQTWDLADEKAQQIRLALRKGINIADRQNTFGAWAEDWLRVKSIEVSYSQSRAYSSLIHHLNHTLEFLPIDRIRSSDIQSVILTLAKNNPNTGKSAAKKTLNDIKITARQIFQLAIDNRVLEYNPAISIRIPKSAPKSSRRALTSEEQEWILETPHRARRAALVMMYAGLRRGKLIPLKWSDIDLENKTININKSVEIVSGRLEIKSGTKTAASTRIIEIPQRLADFLTAEPHENELVCTNAHGHIHSITSFRQMWQSYLLDLNIKYGDFSECKRVPENKFDPNGVPFVIEKITPHMLRHTFATLLYFAGIDVLTAKNQLGHSDIKTTLGIYTHLNQTYKRKQMGKFDEYLECASQMQVKQD
jgi:integrase